MYLDIQKNRTLYDNEKDKTVLVKEAIHYPGEERFKVVLSYGFGAGEIREIVYVNEHDAESFKKRFTARKQERVLILKGSIVEGKNNLTGMREELFKAIRGVADSTVSVEQAKSIASLAQVITNSIKVEIDYKEFIGDLTASEIFK